MDRLTRLDPSNIVAIRVEPGQKCHGQITLHNVMYTMPVAFRLQPLIKTRYTEKPQSGIISPLATVAVEILYHLPPGSDLPHSFPSFRQNYTYKHLFKDCFKYFHNLGIILLMPNNFKDEIMNFV